MNPLARSPAVLDLVSALPSVAPAVRQAPGRVVTVVVLATVALSSGGCKSQVSVPPKYEVTDFVTGIKFTTYRDMGRETPSGYVFRDIDSTDRIALRTYRVRVLKRGGEFDPQSLEAREWKYARARVFGTPPPSPEPGPAQPPPRDELLPRPRGAGG